MGSNLPDGSNDSNNNISSEKENMTSLKGAELAKHTAAFAAVKFLGKEARTHLKVGLGSGSTVVYVAEALRELKKQNASAIASCVPTSYQSRNLILNNALPLKSLDEHEKSRLDVTIDGADEISRCSHSGGFVAIKGGGGCLLQEKVIAHAARELFLVIRSDKMSSYLGENWTKGIPIEVLPMAQALVSDCITTALGGNCVLREATQKAGPIVTDNGNFILDWKFPLASSSSSPATSDQVASSASTSSATSGFAGSCANTDWASVDTIIRNIPGVIETGLFVNMASVVFKAEDSGKLEELHPESK